MEVVPRSRTRVRNPTEQDIIEIFDLRIELESLAARKSAERIPPPQLQQLRQMHDAAEEDLRQGSTRLALEFDKEMHRVILDNCGNERLRQMMGTINDSVAFFRNLGARTPAHRGFNYRHREIIRALAREDGEAAARALAEHIAMAKEQTLRDFEHHKLQNAGENRKQRPRHGEGA